MLEQLCNAILIINNRKELSDKLKYLLKHINNVTATEIVTHYYIDDHFLIYY